MYHHFLCCWIFILVSVTAAVVAKRHDATHAHRKQQHTRKSGNEGDKRTGYHTKTGSKRTIKDWDQSLLMFQETVIRRILEVHVFL